MAANRAGRRAVGPAARGITAVVGFVDKRQDIYNAAAAGSD